jgi:hypothetical protein
MPPDRAARLIAASSRDEHAPEWTADLVKRRLGEAATHIERMERRVGPDRFGPSWINYRLFRNMDDFDRNAQAEGLTSLVHIWSERSVAR